MLQSLTIKHFRGFRELNLVSLKRVNLILGQNNSGKTALLEALAVLLNGDVSFLQSLPSMFRSASNSRIQSGFSFGPSADPFWDWIYHNRDRSKSVEIHGSFERLGKSGVVLRHSSSPQTAPVEGSIVGSLPYITLVSVGGQSTGARRAHVFNTFPSDPQQDAIDFNRVILRRRKKQVEDLLRKIEPRLLSVESLQTGPAPLLYADIGLSEMIPVTQLGQGFNRLLDIYSELVAAEAKVLLIDEIENGLHHSVLETVWSGLFAAARELDVQIFATTHSWECVLAADRAGCQFDPGELNLIRLDRVQDDVRATVIDHAAFETAKQFHWEMR